jgi:homoserine dehydrogenase
MKPLQVGLLGIGTVGSGTFRVLQRNREEIRRRAGRAIEIRCVADLDVARARALVGEGVPVVADARAVIADPEVDVVVELIGGYGIARALVLDAIAAGKHVVTANKALLAVHGTELFAAARERGVVVAFEAAVAGGIPIIKALREGLVANRFKLIYGILNGTCNYILTRMAAEGAGYPEILADAKRLGFAEADESLDVEGWDTAHKASILAHLAHGVWLKPEQMTVEGITQITQADLRHAATLGYGIKLLAIITRDFARDELAVRVHPTLVPKDRVLANVNGVFNGIAVVGDVVGTTTYIGRGAGQDATASAVISDIADAIVLLTTGRDVTPAELPAPAAPALRLAPPDRLRSRYYVRTTVKDQPGVLAQIATAMARHGVSIESVIQTASARPNAASLILTTHESDERAMGATLAALGRLRSVIERPLRLRIADFSE